jgi:serine-type D-Ala-D-Ala carboxypeptidase/endopeptidase (penicillin-binding protein 4)
MISGDNHVMLMAFLQTYAQGSFYYALIVKTRRSINLKTSLSMSRMTLFALGVIFNLFVTSHASALQETPPFNADLERIIRRELPPNCQISCQVVDLNSGGILMEKNPDLSLTPASTMKIVTSACALDTLGPEFRFSTQIYTDEIRGSSIGNLFLKGQGDPHLVTEELFALVRELVDRGLTEIRGSIVVDDSYFDPDKPLDEAEELGYRSYHAPYSALSLNFNSMKIMVIPGNASGNPARLLVDPLSDYASLNGHVNTVPGAGAMKVEITKKPSETDRERLFVEGSIGVETTAKGKYVNVQFPALYTGNVFKELLLREGIKVRGNIINAITPANAILYFEHQSMPLSLLVYWLDKLSNNFMAEQMCLAIGAHVHGAPGSREKGLDVMRRFLIKAGIPETSFNLADASGLSRSNKISASALVKTLSVASQDFYYSPEFISSLGISGADGTLKEKFKDENTRRRIRAKTGTLRGVNSLAGFGLGKNGKPIVFAVIVNSDQKGAGIIDCADKVLRAIFSSALNR